MAIRRSAPGLVPHLRQRTASWSTTSLKQCNFNVLFGWGTWIRTRTDGVRVRRSTVNLFPNKTWSAATRDASWRGPLCIKPARVWQPLFCFDLFNHAITAYGICLVGDCRYTHIADSRDRHINVLMIRDTDSAINRKQVFER